MLITEDKFLYKILNRESLNYIPSPNHNLNKIMCSNKPSCPYIEINLKGMWFISFSIHFFRDRKIHINDSLVKYYYWDIDIANLNGL